MCECVFAHTAHHIYMKINIGNRIDFQEYVHFNKIIYPEFFFRHEWKTNSNNNSSSSNCKPSKKSISLIPLFKSQLYFYIAINVIIIVVSVIFINNGMKEIAERWIFAYRGCHNEFFNWKDGKNVSRSPTKIEFIVIISHLLFHTKVYGCININ